MCSLCPFLDFRYPDAAGCAADGLRPRDRAGRRLGEYVAQMRVVLLDVGSAQVEFPRRERECDGTAVGGVGVLVEQSDGSHVVDQFGDARRGDAEERAYIAFPCGADRLPVGFVE
ncbi:MAG: hypothetical protein BHV59_00855 [Bifidobacterium sp. 56_9_plus]|nr:MAG: hypothetical protein BHV59_00855 [Bifidobacterium sp. 56_9_plus]